MRHGHELPHEPPPRWLFVAAAARGRGFGGSCCWSELSAGSSAYRQVWEPDDARSRLRPALWGALCRSAPLRGFWGSRMSHADYRCDLCGTPRLQRAAGIPLETDHSLNVLFLVEDLELSGGSRDSNIVLLLLLFFLGVR